MASALPPHDVPHARGTLVAGALSAVESLWGDEGLAVLREGLPPEVRRSLCEQIILPVAWYPEEHFERCTEIVWQRLAREDDPLFDEFVRRSVDAVWSRIHRLLMSLATPRLLASRAPVLWRHDHTHGELAVDLGQGAGTVRISGYPSALSSIVRRALTESLRYILSHARVRDVRGSHVLDGKGDFVITLQWS